MRTTALVSILFLFFSTLSSGQDCLPDGITLRSQQEIDQFAANYPGCTTILGRLSIWERETAPITSLAGLSQVTAVGGNLAIFSNAQLSSLQGLHNITSVGALLEITGNPALTNLEGLNSIETVGTNTWIHSNVNLQSLEGLDNLVSIEEDLDISGNTVLENLEGMVNLKTVNGTFKVFFNQTMKTIGRVPELEYVYDFVVGSNNDLESLGNFPTLDTVGNNFSIYENNSLLSFEGLNALKTITQEFYVFSNPLLTCSGIENLTYMGGFLILDNNDSMMSLNGLNDDLVFQNLAIVDNDLLAICNDPGICAFVEANPLSVSIGGNAAGCSNVDEVLSACSSSSVGEPLSKSIELYPNPASNVIRLSSDLTLYQGYKISNANGQVLRSGDFENQRVYLDGLPSGLYFIRLNTDKGVAVLKFSILHKQ